jgi:hypothetical protein
MPGLDPGIHAEPKLAQCFPPSTRTPHLSIDHRIKSGGDESESAVTVACHSSDAEKRIARTIALILPRETGEGDHPSRIAAQDGGRGVCDDDDGKSVIA